MSIILSQDEAERYRNKVSSQDPSVLPVSQPKPSSTGTTPTSSRLNFVWSLIPRLTKDSFPRWARKHAVSRSSVSLDSGCRKESYLCIDKCWTNIKETNMSTISSIETMSDDSQLFYQARGMLNKARGGWIQRFLSWRSYTRVCLSKVCPPHSSTTQTKQG
jgi:hypothetical protein